MQYLVIFSPKKKLQTEGRPADFAKQEIQEQAQTRVLYAGGGLRQVWAHVDGQAPEGQTPKILGAVCLFEAESPNHLQKMIHSFPLVQKDYAEFQIMALQPHAAFLPSKADEKKA